MCSYVVTWVFQISVIFWSLDIAPVPPLLYVYGNIYIYFPPFYRPPDENHKSYSLEKHFHTSPQQTAWFEASFDVLQTLKMSN